jgi:hypothetical protein
MILDGFSADIYQGNILDYFLYLRGGRIKRVRVCIVYNTGSDTRFKMGFRGFSKFLYGFSVQIAR